jgi:hypothetical protein
MSTWYRGATNTNRRCILALLVKLLQRQRDKRPKHALKSAHAKKTPPFEML